MHICWPHYINTVLMQKYWSNFNPSYSFYTHDTRYGYEQARLQVKVASRQYLHTRIAHLYNHKLNKNSQISKNHQSSIVGWAGLSPPCRHSTVCQDTVMFVRASFSLSHFTGHTTMSWEARLRRTIKRVSCFWNCWTRLAWRRLTYS